MSVDPNILPEGGAGIGRLPLGVGGRVIRLAVIGVVLLAVVGTFAYLGGWLSPDELTPAKFADAFEKAGGVHSGFRRNHAKGVCVTGEFESNGRGTRLCKAIIFEVGRVPVMGRFSLSGSDPGVADAADTARGLGLLFSLPDGEEWRMAMVSVPVFPFKTPQSFYERMVASEPDPVTGKPDPEKMKAFAANHPETIRAIGIIMSHPPSSGFYNSTFNSLDAFWFVDAGGASVPVRWSMVPAEATGVGAIRAGTVRAGTTQAASGGPNYLFDDLIARMHRGALQWHLIVTIGQAGDPTNDATILWPEGREQVDVGTLTLNHIESEETSPIRDINFDPLVLPAGIEPSDDPLLSARSAVYSQSFTRREGETKEPSAITPADVGKGGGG